MSKKTIGERIRERRSICGMSQVDLADRIDVSKQTLYKYESGTVTNIPSDKIEKMAIVFDVSPCYLMGWEELETEYDKNEKKLLNVFRGLNSEGQTEAIKQVENLTYNPNYTNIAQFKTKQPDPDPYRVIAAHNDNNDPDQYDLMMEDAADLLDD